MTEYKEIFTRIEDTLYAESCLSKEKFEKRAKKFKNLSYKDMDDRDIFWIMVEVIFYSGFSAAKVKEKLSGIKKYLYDFEKVKNISEKEINRFLEDSDVIRNKRKIEACVNNAKKFDKLLKEYGSFQNYIESFSSLSDEISIDRVRLDLRDKFDYLGKRTVNHFLMDLGLKVLKPYRIICRIFSRLGLIEDEDNISQAIEVGRKMANATDHPIRYIDIIFAKYGQEKSRDFGLEEGICLENNPKCSVCGAERYCDYHP